MTLSPDERIAGLLVPLFALRAEDDPGIGDLHALRAFVKWAAEAGFRLVQLLPVNETGSDHSPYNAISSVALEPSTLATRPGDLPDLQIEDYRRIMAASAAPTREGPVDYPAVKALKRELLTAAYRYFTTEAEAGRVADFEAWCAEQRDWLEGYSLFRALTERHGSEHWDRWPAEVRQRSGAMRWLAALPPGEAAEFAEWRRFFCYIQWIAFTQWRQMRDECEALGVALMGDIPYGVSYYGADVFSSPEIFDLDWSGGAPPERVFKSDPFTEKWGQNWGVPLYRWDVLERNDYRWWRERIRRVRDAFHLFRIDHVLGFYRIYGFPWRPERNGEFLPLSEEEARERTGGELPRFQPRDDSTPERREANCREGERILRVLLEEAGEYRLIGEDLGVVPDYVRPNLASLGIAGFKIPQWERQPDTRLIPGRDYPRLSLATYATHDHPPLAMLWREMSDAAAHDGHARWELEQLGAFAGLGVYGPEPYTEALQEALLAALFQSNAWIAVVMITDLFGTTQRFNVPGSVSDGNWSVRLEGTPAEWRKDAVLRERLERVREFLKASERL